MTDGPTDGGPGDRLRTVADYQFGAGAGAALFPPGEDREVSRTKSGRVRQVVAPGAGRLVSVGTDGRLTISLAAGRRLRAAFDQPRGRVVVGEESDPHVRAKRNAFAKFVRAADPDIRPGDEVLVTRADDTLLAVGRAELDAGSMDAFQVGVAVDVREGAGTADGPDTSGDDSGADASGGGSPP